YEEAYTGLKSEAASEQPSVETATAVDQWLSALRAMLQTQVVCLASTTSGTLAPESEGGRAVPCIGWRDGEEVHLHPDVSFHEVTKYLGSGWSASQTELHRQLLDAETEVDGHEEPVSVLSRIEVSGGKRRAKRKQTAGGNWERVRTVDRIV